MGTPSRHSTSFLAALLLAAAALCQGAGMLQIEQKLLQLMERDTTADPFMMLAADEKKKWAFQPQFSINQTMQQLVHIPVRPIVEVRLIGFSGRNKESIFLSAPEVLRYLHALRADMDTVVLQPALADLAVTPAFEWSVQHDNTGMGPRLETAVKTAIAQAAADPHSAGQPEYGTPTYIPHTVVDALISQDATRVSKAALTIYLLNLQTGLHKYAYTYMKGHEETPGFCAGTHYIGAAGSPKPAYVWVDISAGPVTYGPGRRQQGHVYEHALPHPQQYKDAKKAAALVPQLAATVWSATRHLAWPPLQHTEVQYRPRIIIDVIHIHESLTRGPNKFSGPEVEQALKAALGSQQAVEVREHFVTMAACPLCAEAYQSALRIRTARDENTQTLATKEHKVLDQQVLHRLMARYQDMVFGQAGATYSSDPRANRMLPVFLYELQETQAPVLFAGGSHAAAFPDMVLAVTSRAGVYHTQAICGLSQVSADTLDARRAVLGALLTAGWGLTNTSTAYTPAAGVEPNHMWSLTNTPFGPLSSALRLSGPMAQLLPRNMALGHLNATTSRLLTLLAGFSRLSKHGKFDEASCGEYRHRVLTRVNLAMFKVQQAAAAMSQADYWKALLYARSLSHEVQHLERLVLKISKTLGTKLHCQSGPTLGSVWWAPCIAIATWPLASFLRKRLFKQKLDKLY